MLLVGGSFEITLECYMNDITNGVVVSSPIDLTGGSAVMKYRRPDGIVGQWIASVVDEENGVIRHALTPVENDIPGKWLVWAICTLADLSEIPTGAISFAVEPQGTV